MINGYFGWGMILTAFVTGAVLGVYFHRDDFLGGYSTFRRRILRLGHISLAALGMLNVLFSLSPAASAAAMSSRVASLAFIVGGITMPAVCFLTSWRAGFRHWFFIPVTALIVAVIQTLRISSP